MNGSMVKNHISLKTGFGFPVTRRTSFLLWFQACQIRLLDLTHQLRGHFQDRGVIAQHLLPARLHHPQQVKLRLENERIELKVTSLQLLCQLKLMSDQGDPMLTKPIKIQNQIKRNPRGNGATRCLPTQVVQALKSRRENLVEDEIPEHGDSHASSSHEASLEPILKRREDLGKHSVYTHFPKDRNCEICQRTKITRPCAEDEMVEPYLVLKILVT